MKNKPVFAELAVLMDMLGKSVQLLNIKKEDQDEKEVFCHPHSTHCKTCTATYEAT